MIYSQSPHDIAAQIYSIRQTIPQSVRLIAVTKQMSADVIRVAYDAGIRDFGENRVQEAIAKQEQLQDLSDITWHLIGHLQRNKVASALQYFQWIHSVDSLKLAQRMHQLAERLDARPNVLLQVKILPDPTKYGWTPEELLAHLPELDQCTHLNIVGLMAIAPYGLDETDTHFVFAQTHDLADKIRQKGWNHIQMNHLSMGMSEDYSLAIAAGATMVRLGRILFGERQ
jgi:pyridoxal phosphate enzyme (YggS family)